MSVPYLIAFQIMHDSQSFQAGEWPTKACGCDGAALRQYEYDQGHGGHSRHPEVAGIHYIKCAATCVCAMIIYRLSSQAEGRDPCGLGHCFCPDPYLHVSLLDSMLPLPRFKASRTPKRTCGLNFLASNEPFMSFKPMHLQISTLQILNLFKCL